MNQFTGTAYYYAKYRPGIPAEVSDYLIAEANRFAPARRLLDLGTGTGQVVVALGPAFDHIIAVDSDTEMLEVARTRFRISGINPAQVRLVLAKAEEFDVPEVWQADLVSICRAFHWMDYATVLSRLKSMVAPTGAVAIFGDRSFWDANSPWKEAVRSVIQEFLGEQRRAGTGVFTHHDRPYSEILQESPFSLVTEATIPIQRSWTTESILGYLYSTSFASRGLFGDRLADFETAVRRVLAELSSEDRFSEENEFIIRIGRTPSP